MMRAIRESALFRMMMFFAGAAGGSIFARGGRWFTKHYQHSGYKHLWDGFIRTPVIAAPSAYGKAMALVARLSEMGCPFLARIYRGSAVSRAGSALYRWARFSRLLGIFAGMGFRKLAILALALYVLIDYVLRDIVRISLVASLWDEGLLVLLCLYIAFHRGASARPQIKQRETTLDLYLLAFIAVGFLLMCVVCPYPKVALDGYRAAVQYMFWFFVLMRLLANRKDFLLFYYALTVLVFIMCLHGIYQFAVAAPIPDSWVTQTEMGVRTRVFSITGSPNIFGSLIVLVAPLAAGLIYYWKGAKAKLAAWIMLGTMCLSVLFTFSRGAWVGAVVAVLVFAVFVDRRLILLMGIGGAGILMFVPSITNRITYLFTNDFVEASMKGGRMIRWESGMSLLSGVNEFFGFGLGRFGGAVAMQNRLIEESEVFRYFYLDNYYLKTLVEMGYLGLGFYIVLLAGLVLWSLRSIGRLRGERDFPLVCGIFAGLCGVMVHCYYENIFEVPYMMAYFWMLAAALICRGYFIAGRQNRPKLAQDETFLK